MDSNYTSLCANQNKHAFRMSLPHPSSSGAWTLLFRKATRLTGHRTRVWDWTTDKKLRTSLMVSVCALDQWVPVIEIQRRHHRTTKSLVSNLQNSQDLSNRFKEGTFVDSRKGLSLRLHIFMRWLNSDSVSGKKTQNNITFFFPCCYPARESDSSALTEWRLTVATCVNTSWWPVDSHWGNISMQSCALHKELSWCSKLKYVWAIWCLESHWTGNFVTLWRDWWHIPGQGINRTAAIGEDTPSCPMKLVRNGSLSVRLPLLSWSGYSVLDAAEMELLSCNLFRRRNLLVPGT